MPVLLVWNDQYSVQIPEIDQQHKKLFALINNLYDQIMQGHAEEAIDSTLKALIDYTRIHFDFEERLMREGNYIHYAEHCAAHAELIRRIAEFDGKKLRGDLGDELMAFLFDWLTVHILEEDMKYAASLAAHKGHALEHLTPRQAHKYLHDNPNAVLIDVRSEMEFLFVGHPVGAVIIPWYNTPDWDLNPNFIAEVRMAASLNRPVVLICRSGNRSVEAGKTLLAAGMTEVYNVLYGFEGELDEHHHRGTRNGWRFDGLPWEQC